MYLLFLKTLIFFIQKGGIKLIKSDSNKNNSIAHLFSTLIEKEIFLKYTKSAY